MARAGRLFKYDISNKPRLCLEELVCATDSAEELLTRGVGHHEPIGAVNML